MPDAEKDAGWELPPCGHIECADRQSDSCPSRDLPPMWSPWTAHEEHARQWVKGYEDNPDAVTDGDPMPVVVCRTVTAFPLHANSIAAHAARAFTSDTCTRTSFCGADSSGSGGADSYHIWHSPKSDI